MKVFICLGNGVAALDRRSFRGLSSSQPTTDRSFTIRYISVAQQPYGISCSFRVSFVTTQRDA